ncbi:hypothetical protein H2199_005242 [Coniosporium tulheliwenetii]|uniref:Uncharacterized protein n=1 Tax=Coniosporium tulheliwenetii TaxID=3383036 RepID=A0ACC2Z3Q7_9PEZI|nr:hypothetical protein H2199_005242 [Cladosporium sp. JES 115]
MKAVRGILAENMELAREGLVSKSNVENETYLFRAACSELRTETQTKRRAAMEKMRTERTQLQHEVDMLNQRFGQEMANMKEELKGMFDDRKMAVRMEQRDVDSKIQQLNYKITVTLNSDARSEVEGLRWVLTRRAAMAVVLSALMILSTLKYQSYMTQLQENERKKMAEKDTKAATGESGGHGSGGGSGLLRPIGGGEEVIGEELLASQGGGQGYVSLG